MERFSQDDKLSVPQNEVEFPPLPKNTKQERKHSVPFSHKQRHNYKTTLQRNCMHAYYSGRTTTTAACTAPSSDKNSYTNTIPPPSPTRTGTKNKQFHVKEES